MLSIGDVVFFEIEMNSMSHFVPARIVDTSNNRSKIEFEGGFQEDAWIENDSLFSLEMLSVRMKEISFDK